MNESAPRNPVVLVVDDEEPQRVGLAKMVSAWGYAVATAADGEEALERVAAGGVGVIVTDLMMPRLDGHGLLKALQAQGGGPPAIMLTAFGSFETAVSTIHDLGAFWFMEKPVQPAALRLLIERAMRQSRLAEERDRLERVLSHQGVLGNLVGRSPVMRQIFQLIQQVAPSRAAVLITGESGTGKELVARAIHNHSTRRDGPFVAINCAALPETLIESELFGHEKGAFTGALERRAGCFELAQGGTLLLDEIGEMPMATQTRLLRVLEDSRVRRLGAKKEVDVDVRVIAATNKRPDQAVRKGELREDLFFRLNVFHIDLPPLRDRKEDLPDLTAALIHDLNAKHGCHVTDIHPEVAALFARHHWPGNIRELRNVLERAVILAGEGSVLLRHLPPNFGSRDVSPRAEPDDPFTIHVPIGTTVDDAEKMLILRTLDYTANNKTRAAEILGVSLKTMHNKLKLYGAASATDEE